MANNDNQGRAGTRMHAMARLARWACLLLGAVSSIGLHAMASRPYEIVVDPGGVGSALGDYLLGGVLESLQYLVPALCLSALLAHLARLPDAPRAAGRPSGGRGLGRPAAGLRLALAVARARRALRRARVGAGSLG